MAVITIQRDNGEEWEFVVHENVPGLFNMHILVTRLQYLAGVVYKRTNNKYPWEKIKDRG